ncbi:MAG: TraR/DksA C4-type zinc finger protein [Gammaproteobacteria bacterium]|nr:TraR/DksA C4-type zinc finger protein [Gammaproteobacteria bacterium]
MLTPTQTTQLKAKIEADILQLQEDISGLEAMTQPISPDNAIGRLSRMDAINTRSANQTALNAAKVRLAKLTQTLPTIDCAEYNECEACLVEIPFARLMLVPESEYCVACSEKLSE